MKFGEHSFPTFLLHLSVAEGERMRRIEHDQLPDQLRMFEHQRPGNRATPIVAGKVDLLVSQFMDQVDNILNQKLASATNFFTPSPPPRPTYTPGISRRNRERAQERMWRRD